MARDTKDRHDDHYNIYFIRVRTDEGIMGFGETYPRHGVDAELIHEQLAPIFLDSDPRDVERLWSETYKRANYHGGYGGAEILGLSAIDIALWDIKGKYAGYPYTNCWAEERTNEYRRTTPSTERKIASSRNPLNSHRASTIRESVR